MASAPPTSPAAGSRHCRPGVWRSASRHRGAKAGSQPRWSAHSTRRICSASVAFEAALEILAGVEAPPGRMQRLGGGDRPLVVIDYAHTPDALDKVLTALR